ncbi:chondroitin AC/alginate lyase [Pilobolus umbonatus]|nr:chondroitin AC/alginate lyase [Pilobolus umbonatus]
MHFLSLLLLPLCLCSSVDIATLYERKVGFILQDNRVYAPEVPSWDGNFTISDGTWKDVDYAAGCDGRRANWPAQQHFIRLVALSSLYYMDLYDDLPAISAGMDYWFQNDYTPDTCLDEGGLTNSTCPCGTPGLWNTNWFGQMILLPRLITNTCLLLKSNLTPFQIEGCTRIGERVLNRIDTWIYSIGFMTGANMLDAATTILNLGLITDNETIVQTALDHFYNQTLVTKTVGEDGIKVDGSYLQHFALLYTGNYGKDYINSVTTMYLQTAETQYAAPLESQLSFETLMNGTQWMVVFNNNPVNYTRSDVLWQYSVIGRMVSFAAIDKQASGGVNMNFTKIIASTADWENGDEIQSMVEAMSTIPIKGQGQLSGTQYFYTSDYLVHRDSNYVTTLKMYSSRTTNAECVNSQNPYGFHLSDGAIFTYIDGDEYLDVFAAWDWYLVPGTTVDYGATVLECLTTQWYGISPFVGGVTGSAGGLAVMKYENPMNGTLQWEKTFFFFPGFYVVHINILSSATDAPIITTLDQSNLKGNVYINGRTPTNTTFKKDEMAQLWHNRVLYTVPGNQLNLTVGVGVSSNWSSIGISVGQATQPLFTATLKHTLGSTYYIAQLDHKGKTSLINSLVQIIQQDHATLGTVRGVYDSQSETLALAFWSRGSYRSPMGWKFTASEAILIWFHDGLLTISDPSQMLTSVVITVSNRKFSRKLDILLPQNEYAGSSVTYNLNKS